ncbi:hypothetical protein K7432_010942 [Basidiobolus ranarum]|uniref:Wbp11/ELF5/Saf1 N-terminal domain-containing protein n=1 Tax=Basidiobolus ranarum TaxID=34480 RepID=A0ABR2VUQ6_9FUNG
MGKSGRSANPTDTYRKQMKQKELKRNKEERKRLREVGLALKDTTKLEIDLSKYKKLEKDGKLDKNGKSKMAEIEAEIKKIHAVKKEHGIPIKSLPNPQDTPSSSFSQTSGRDPTKAIYYHPTLNPFGAPPPGAPYVEHANENSLLNVDYSDGEEDGSNGSQPDEDNEESDPKNAQNIVYPPPPPSARPPPHAFQPFPPHMRPGMVVPPPPGINIHLY